LRWAGAGDDDDAKGVAANLARELGFAPVDLGPSPPNDGGVFESRREWI